MLEKNSGAERRGVAVVVVGDIGRSPRMCNHASCLGKLTHFQTFVVGYRESSIPRHLSACTVCPLPPPFIDKYRRLFPYIFYIFFAIIKVLCVSYNLFKILYDIPNLNFVLMQNPPSLPALPVCALVCYLKRAKLIVDFHNYGYSIMELQPNVPYFMVYLALRLEVHYARYADYALCVSKAMKADLISSWRLKCEPVVVYDHPLTKAPDVSFHQKHAVWFKLFSQNSPAIFDMSHETKFPRSRVGSNTGVAEDTLLSYWSPTDGLALKNERPAMVLSSTSWSPDEDFSVLLQALSYYKMLQVKSDNLPELVVVITGKGPLREQFVRNCEARGLNERPVRIITKFLDLSDYYALLSGADLGVCLHTSSSGLDLPMKIVDMLGCGVPVCAFEFPTLHELINCYNAVTFSDATTLCQELVHLLEWFPTASCQLCPMARYTELHVPTCFGDEWVKKCKPIFDGQTGEKPLQPLVESSDSSTKENS
eukprot:Platyproteum_vivax@DN4986_c0_g1_i2.p1